RWSSCRSAASAAWTSSWSSSRWPRRSHAPARWPMTAIRRHRRPPSWRTSSAACHGGRCDSSSASCGGTRTRGGTRSRRECCEAIMPGSSGASSTWGSRPSHSRRGRSWPRGRRSGAQPKRPDRNVALLLREVSHADRPLRACGTRAHGASVSRSPLEVETEIVARLVDRQMLGLRHGEKLGSGAHGAAPREVPEEVRRDAGEAERAGDGGGDRVQGARWWELRAWSDLARLVPDDGDTLAELRRLHAAIDDGSDVAELGAIRTFLHQERAADPGPTKRPG